jgi:serine/threonine protein kinase
LNQNEAHFVQLEGWFQNDTHLYIAMEYFELGDLQNCIDEPVSEADAQNIMFQLNEAIYFMHGKGFTHRDLKPAVRADLCLVC